ncbi:phosphate ABC transporter permease PstA [Anaerococcus kampingiae]|uniref:Phosphate transport system permease protein PstA n=1 Tax=Anaerococcus kampingae TaxID=3115614 RepID=A0ABW9MA87_9FIRM
MSKLFKGLIMTLTTLGYAVSGIIIAYILFEGIPNISPGLFSLKYTSENVSIMPSLIATLMTIIITLLVSLPVGIFTAIYLSNYAKNKFLIKAVRFSTEILSSIPSIVYGLFGYLFFVTSTGLGLGMQYSLLAGCLTAAIMVLPTIIRTTEEAILTVNPLQAHASLALGATKIQTIFKVILPDAMDGILGGIFLSTGRIVGESAALIYTMGTHPEIPKSLFDSARTMAVHMYVLSSEGLHVKEAYATAVLLLVFVVIINFLSAKISKKIVKA